MSASLQELIEELQASGSLKVWSLIITFFGDAVEPRGGVVAASTLQSVMEVMGVGAGAVRTACSRLAKDGWIERQKQGRNSYYRLSDMGHAPFRTATQQIYAPPPALLTQADAVHPDSQPAKRNSSLQERRFTLIIQNPMHSNSSALSSDWQILRNKGIRINNNTTLFEHDASLGNTIDNLSASNDLLVLSNATAHFPDWIKRSVCSEKSAQRYHHLIRRFESIRDNPPTDSLVALAIRCLLIHEWRRLLLRNAPVPIELAPSKWPHDSCHQFVANLYLLLFNTGEQWMNDYALGPHGPLKITDSEYRNRFLDIN